MIPGIRPFQRDSNASRARKKSRDDRNGQSFSHSAKPTVLKQDTLDNIIDLYENDDDAFETFRKVKEMRTIDLQDKESSSSSTKNYYCNEEKQLTLKLLAKFKERYPQLSHKQAIESLQASLIAEGLNAPARIVIDAWKAKADRCEPFDTRSVSVEFENAVMTKLYEIEAERIRREGYDDESVDVSLVMTSIPYSAQMCKFAASEVAQQEPFCRDPRVDRIKKFESSWASEFLKRAGMKNNIAHTKDIDTRSNNDVPSAQKLIPILTDTQIDALAVGQHGLLNIKKSLVERGHIRHTRHKLSQLVQELKDVEAGRRLKTVAVAVAAPAASVPEPSGVAAVPAPAQQVSASVQKRLCVCKCPEEGDGKPMIGCDREGGCPYGERYHYACLMLNKRSSTKNKQWICPLCQFNM